MTRIVYTAPVFDRSGLAEDARRLILAMARAGFDVRVDPMLRHPWTVRLADGTAERIERLMVGPDRDRSVHVVHGRTVDLHRPEGAAVAIGRTFFETVGPLPLERLAALDELWVASTFNLEALVDAGVERERLWRIPPVVPVEVYGPELPPLELPGLGDGFVFLSAFAWHLRKGWDVLVRAYLEEFAGDDDVTLAVKVELDPSIVPTLDQVRRRLGGYLRDELGVAPADGPPIVLLDLDLSDFEMARLYRTADAFVLPSRGEGWGRPYMEAMAAGTPTIGTRATGNLDFMSDENSLLVDCTVVDVPEPGWREVPRFRGHRWAEPSVEHLRRCMRLAYTERAEMRARAARAREEILSRYGAPEVAALLATRLGARGVVPAPQEPPGSLAATVTWEGDLFAGHATAVANRELCRALIGTGRADLRLLAPPHPDDVPAAPAYTSLLARLGSPPAGIRVRHERRPAPEPPPDAAPWIVWHAWDYGAVPLPWVELLRGPVSEVWVPTTYLRDRCIAAGVSPDRVAVVPGGVNTLDFHPGVPALELPTTKRFRFLYVGPATFRKGIDIALETYVSEFRASDEVCLVVKDAGAATRGADELREQILGLRADRDSPEILYIEDDWPHRAMPHLYAACQSLLHPCRSQGFGLAMLEAMAGGLAIITTGHGGSLDFCDPDVAHLVGALEARPPIPRVDGVETALPPVWAEPDREQLAAAMRRVVADPAAARDLGARAAARAAARFTWAAAADRALERLSLLAGRAAG